MYDLFNKFHDLTDIETMEKGGLLPETQSNIRQKLHILLKADSQNRAKIRSASFEFENLFGSTIFGRSLESLFSSLSQKKLNQTLTAFFETPSIARLTFAHGHDQYQMNLVPVHNDAREDNAPERITYALGLMDFAAQAVIPQPCLILINAEVTPLPAEPISETTPPQDRQTGFAEPKARFQAKPRGADHLSLVVDNDVEAFFSRHLEAEATKTR